VKKYFGDLFYWHHALKFAIACSRLINRDRNATTWWAFWGNQQQNVNREV
jgi:hypothetical protein